MTTGRRGMTRRQVLQRSALTVGALALAGPGAHFGWAQGTAALRVGIVGCGRRGAQAAKVLQAIKGVEIAALADVFQDRVGDLKKAHGVKDDHCFAGLDACRQLVALADVSLVVLATPPAFRPGHVAAAVAAGKHVFMEAPVAICPAGVKMVLEATKLATDKKLALGVGLQRRHQPIYIETMARVLGGDIGTLVSAQCYANGGSGWVSKRQGNETDVEWQLRNWPYFRWLSGDFVVEQHVHQLDVINWAFGALPGALQGLGGRQARKAPEYGDVWDHFGVEFTYPNDVKTMSICRQIDGTDERVGERLVGTAGTVPQVGVITGAKAWTYNGPTPDPLAQTLQDLVASVRAGAPLNEGQAAADSALTAVMARESSYSRQQFNRDWFQGKCTLALLPPEGLKLSDAKPVDAVPLPGTYVLAGFPKK